MRPTSRFLALAFLLSSTISFAQPRSIAGHWEGAIRVQGGELAYTTDFIVAGDSTVGTIDIPQQGAKAIPLRNIHTADAAVHFELPTGGATALFEGKRSGDSITGDFKQGSFSGTFTMRSRPTYFNTGILPPPLPPPYRVEEVKITNGAITLAGTLTVPPLQARYPAVILVTGSGPQNRDEEIFGFTPFQLIADSLTRAGIAVLRYDDRGVGESTGNFADATTADFATDALAALRYLASRPEIDPKKIGMLGHSEGGEIAPMVANRSNNGLAFIVLMAGPGVKGSEIINAQVATMARASGRPEEEIRSTMQFQEKLYAALRSGKGLDALEEEIRQTARKQLASLPAAVLDTLDTARIIATMTARLASARTPWFKYFIDADPAKELQTVKCPVLAIFGGLDMQVPAETNKGAVEAALKKGGNRDVTVVVLPKANHLFQEAHTGLPGEYATLNKVFIPGFLAEITKWIQTRTRGKK